MRVISWNCRGLGKSSTILQCQKIALKFRPDVLFLMETQLERDKAKGIWSRCGFFMDGSTREMDWVDVFCLLGCQIKNFKSLMLQSTWCTQTCWTTKVLLFPLPLFMVTLYQPKGRKFGASLKNWNYYPTLIGFVLGILTKSLILRTNFLSLKGQF